MKRLRKKSVYTQAFNMVESIWGRAEICPLSSIRKDSGPRYIREARAHVVARHATNDDRQEVCPYSENRLPSAEFVRVFEKLATSLQERQQPAR